MTRTYPNESLQAVVGSWWISESSSDIRVGRLILAAVPHVDQVAKMITPVGRKAADIHDSATFKVEPFNIKNYSKHSKLPVAGMPAFEGEINLVQRAKRRPCLVVGLCGPEVQKSDNPGKPGWQTAPTYLVAPFYGVDEGDKRAGWAEPFVRRIRACEYPQFIWDQLPVKGSTESILRMDQIQAIGRHHNSLDVLSWCLTDDAVVVINDWLHWVRNNEIENDSVLEIALAQLREVTGVTA